MTTRNRIRGLPLLAALAASAGSWGAPALGQINEHNPGSVLIYPIYISNFTSGDASVVTVTNTNGDRRSVLPGSPPGLRGDVQAHYFWVDGQGTWDIFDQEVLLTPNDTRSTLSYDALRGTGNGDFEQGFLVISAEDPETQESVDFDYLIGDIILIDVLGNRSWNTEAIGIQALVDERGVPNADRSRRGHAFTDRVANGGDGDGRLDFDAVEYQRWPNLLFLSSFFRQDNGSNGTNNDAELILLTDLGRDFRINLQFYFYDRDEGESSRSGLNFICWTRADLHALFSGTAGPLYDPAGWARLDAPDAINLQSGQIVTQPNLLGALVQRVLGMTGLEFGHLLHHSGLNPTHAELALQ